MRARLRLRLQVKRQLSGHRWGPGGIRVRSGKGRCASSPFAGSARCDGAGAVSSGWDPSHTGSPGWAASRVGGLWILEVSYFPPFRSEVGGFVRLLAPQPTSGCFHRVPPGQLGDPGPSPRSGPECVCGCVCVWRGAIRKRCWGEGRMAPGPADNGQRMEPPGGVSCRKLLCLREAVLRGQGGGGC